jgi:DNA-binding beta-propeller fold protein YncE
MSVAVAPAMLFIAEGFRPVIRKVDLKTGKISTLTTSEPLEAISQIILDPHGDLLVVEFTMDRIRKIELKTGRVETVIGGRRLSFTGDGGPAISAGLARPNEVAFDSAGNLFIVDMGNHRIRRVDSATGIISTVAGNGRQETSGDDGPASEAGFEFPNSVAVDTDGNLFIAQSGYSPKSHRIRRVDARTGVIQTIAGTDSPGIPVDEVRASAASLQSPSHLRFNPAGDLLFVDPVNDRVFCVEKKTGLIRALVGTTKGFAGDGKLARTARLNNPSGLAVDNFGNLYIPEFVNNRVRYVDALTGIIRTIAGNGLPHRIDVIL